MELFDKIKNKKSQHPIQVQSAIEDGLGNNIDETYAKQSGAYPDLYAGEAELADNLKGHLNDSVTAEYDFRTSGGATSIGSGNANITKIRGNTVVWNQLANKWSNPVVIWAGGSYISPVLIDGGKGIRLTCTQTGTTNLVIPVYLGTNLTIGHKYLVDLRLENDTLNYPAATVVYQDSTQTFIDLDSNNMFTAPGSGKYYAYVFKSDEQLSLTEGTSVDVYVKVIDLTAMFGNSTAIPNLTLAEFKKQYFPLRYYDYEPGKFVSFTANDLKTVGFNLFDFDEGSANLIGGYNYEILGDYSTLTYIDINGTTSTITPDSNGIFTPATDGVLNITGTNRMTTCVHLVHSGYRNGDFETYWENALDLSFIKSIMYNGSPLFPNGLRSVGAYGCDEITSTYAIKKVFDFDESHSPVYAIEDAYGNILEVGYETPITVYFDTPLDLSYRVDDFGSEQIEPIGNQQEIPTTTNIDCDVYYALNAVDVIRLLPGKVDELNKVEAASYNQANTQLNGVKIGDTTYRIFPLNVYYDTQFEGFSIGNTTPGRAGVAIGKSAVGGARYGTAVGYGSNGGLTFYATALGYYSKNSQTSGIAIGAFSNNSIENGVSFDGTSNDYVRTIHLKSPANIFFRNANVDTSKTTFAAYQEDGGKGKYLQEYLDEKITQCAILPTGLSSTDVGKIVQYTGVTNSTETNGYFYKCVESSSDYVWEQADVQPASGGTTVVAQTSYDGSLTALQGITIGDTTYKLPMVNELSVQIGDGINMQGGNAIRSVVIGSKIAAGTNGRVNTIAIGHESKAGYGSVSIGRNADCNLGTGDGSVAIGMNAVARIDKTVNFDGTNEDRTIVLRDTDKIFFRNESVSKSKGSYASYTDGKTLKQYLDAKEDTPTVVVDKVTTSFASDNPTPNALELITNTRYVLGELTKLEFVFPVSTQANPIIDGEEITISFVSGATATNVVFSDTNSIYNFNSVGANKFIEFNAAYRESIDKWVVLSSEVDYTIPTSSAE